MKYTIRHINFLLGVIIIFRISGFAAERSIVERFKDYLQTRPPIENVMMTRKMLYTSFLDEKFPNSREICIYAGRWENDERYFVQGLFDPKQRNVPSMEKIVSGQSNEVYYSVQGGKLTLGEKPKTGPKGIPVVALSTKPLLDIALNLGCDWIKAGTWRWEGDTFQAEVEGGAIAGRLEVENELPKSLVYRGKGTYVRPDQDYILEYSYEGSAEGSFVPSKIRKLVKRAGAQHAEPMVDYAITEFQLANDSIPGTALDPQQFIVSRWDNVFYKTKDGVFYKQPGQKAPSPVLPIQSASKGDVRRFRPAFVTLILILMLAPALYVLFVKRMHSRSL